MEPITTIILSLIKAIPAVRDIYLKIQEKITQEQIAKIDIKYVKREEKKSLLLFKIEETKDLNEKLILFSAYNDIDRMSDN